MPQLGIETVLVAGRGPAGCAAIRACQRLGLKAVAVHSETERSARHVRLADDAVLLGPAPAAESYLAVDRIVEAARRSGADTVLPVPPALAGNARLAGGVIAAGLRWGGPDPEVLERLGGDGVEPASERGFLAWVTAEGLRFTTPVARDRAAGIARVSWTPGEPGRLPAAAHRLAEVGWRGLVTVGIAPDGSLAEVAAGFSLDMAVLERSHGVDAVELALRSAAGLREADAAPEGRPAPRAAVAAQLRATLPPGTAGRISGRLPGAGRPPAVDDGVALVAVSGYEPGDRLDGWYDALLATVSGGADDVTAAARAVSRVLSGLPEAGVPHDGPEVCAVLGRLAGDGVAPAT
ncbi:carbamoyl-phosphate-synthetase [Blastococcus sp. MG754426]|uniref:biotin carboxylase N-terminal domain-containing protein n=1 Tax=unclassified Blastococcus TaxID=2619396 RepID=UPI001EF00B35|nr:MULTISPECIES: biotin carboxylase N-terminal domain-containing protein [unclassified Blastococcus]MCF6506011.1 carbamoyl-phosphate-synthetase [Blastococcus sp. MG754426]MCF6510603.1 carbamoyl-phosphate-synthetase [Blastococcus sp. MG754427]